MMRQDPAVLAPKNKRRRSSDYATPTKMSPMRYTSLTRTIRTQPSGKPKGGQKKALLQSEKKNSPTKVVLGKNVNVPISPQLQSAITGIVRRRSSVTLIKDTPLLPRQSPVAKDRLDWSAVRLTTSRSRKENPVSRLSNRALYQEKPVPPSLSNPHSPAYNPVPELLPDSTFLHSPKTQTLHFRMGKSLFTDMGILTPKKEKTVETTHRTHGPSARRPYVSGALLILIAWLTIFFLRYQKLSDAHFRDNNVEWHSSLNRRMIQISPDLQTSVIESGSVYSDKAIIFLHGFPETALVSTRRFSQHTHSHTH